MVQAGQYVTDGTAVFIVTDIRDGLQVGDIKLSPVLRQGYVKANGALLTSARANYPRLVTFLQENPSLNAADDTAWADNKALYVYDDANDTLRVPDATGRVLQGGATARSVEAGLPNITGGVDFHKTNSNIGIIATANGAFSKGAVLNVTYQNLNTQTASGSSNILSINASSSSPIYGGSTTVQPPALTMIPQIKY